MKHILVLRFKLLYPWKWIWVEVNTSMSFTRFAGQKRFELINSKII